MSRSFVQGNSSRGVQLPEHLDALFNNGPSISPVPLGKNPRRRHTYAEPLPVANLMNMFKKEQPKNNSPASVTISRSSDSPSAFGLSVPDAQIDCFLTKLRKYEDNRRMSLSQRHRLLDSYDPHQSILLKGIQSDSFCCVFVGRLNYDTSEDTLRSEFEKFGPIRSVHVVRDLKNKSRGYGFVEFERDRDSKEAVRGGNGMLIDGRSVVVDVERGRTVRGWRPRRLGGGVGSGYQKPMKNSTRRRIRFLRRAAGISRLPELRASLSNEKSAGSAPKSQINPPQSYSNYSSAGRSSSSEHHSSYGGSRSYSGSGGSYSYSNSGHQSGNSAYGNEYDRDGGGGRASAPSYRSYRR